LRESLVAVVSTSFETRCGNDASAPGKEARRADQTIHQPLPRVAHCFRWIEPRQQPASAEAYEACEPNAFRRPGRHGVVTVVSFRRLACRTGRPNNTPSPESFRGSFCLMIAERETRLQTFRKSTGTAQNLRGRKTGRKPEGPRRQTISVLVVDDIAAAAALSPAKAERARPC
jgi:hypothetical protein